MKFLAAFLCCCFSLLLNAQINPVQQAAVDRIFKDWTGAQTPGCALAIIQNGRIAYQTGYGMADLEHNIPITPQTVFYIGSVSKQFVTTCMLLLQEQGLIDLDDDIRKYLPDFPDYGKPITIRHLIHHTSGIRDNLTLWELAGRSHLDEIDPVEIYELIKRQKALNFTPGERHLYSNSCYFMMSLVLEKVTGQSLHDYAQQHIFEPLDMHNTLFQDDNRRILPNRAFGYNINDDGKVENMLMRFDLVGSGGVYSTVEDLFHWDQNFYRNRIGKSGQALIDSLHQNGRLNDGSEINYAFAMVNGRYKGLRTVSHTGSLGGYRAFYLRFPDEAFSVILLGNAATFRPTGLGYLVADVFLSDKFASHPLPVTPGPPKAKTAPGPPPSRADWAGTYWNGQLYESIRLFERDGQWWWQQPGEDPAPLKAAGEGRFDIPGASGDYLQLEQYASGPQLALFTGNNRTRYDRLQQLAPATSAHYDGSYYSEELDTRYQIRHSGGNITLQMRYLEPQPLVTVGPDLLALPGQGALRITRDQNGQITGFQLDVGWVKGLAFERSSE